MNFHIEYHLN